MGLLQFNVSVGEKTRPVHIQESAGVDELFRKVSADCANNVDPQDIRLVFGDVQLEYNQNKSFKDYSLVHMSTLTLLVRLHGGGNKPTNARQQQSTSLPTQRATRPKERVVELHKIRTWAEFYDNDKEDLKKCLQANGNAWRQELESEYAIDPEINSKVSLFEGDITSLQVDGIVSSDNSDLTAAGGVSFRIKTAAGPWFEHATKALKGICAGDAMVSPGCLLPATYVVHTVGPQEEEPKILENCYKNCLEKIETMSIKSLAFPCIATGSYEYPNDKAVLVALKTVRVWLEEQKHAQQLEQIARIIFCLFTPEDVALYRTWMQVFYPCQEAPHISRKLVPLPGFIKTTTTEPDMLGLDEEGTVLAKMPCGHVIGPESMTEYCTDILNAGEYSFNCPDPACNAEWQYFLVRHVACLTPSEMQEFERKISENFMKREGGYVQRCPGCDIPCIRLDKTKNYLKCLFCGNKQGTEFLFCWMCRGTWNVENKDTCGNTRCHEDYAKWMMQQKISNLQPLDGFIEITTEEPDMISFDDDPQNKRAKMPCGHVIGPESMTEYCTGILNDGKYSFPCPDPGCDAEWQYFLVRHVACLTSSQMQEFETKISENFMKRDEEGVQRCPGCDIPCTRKDKTKNCVKCLFCSKKQKTQYLFCWKCLGTWNGGNWDTCGNARCHGVDNRIEILASCPNKLILEKFDAPSVRGCPKCGLLIEYLRNCTQMHCKGCDHFFCFLCLQGAKTKKELKCHPYNSTCQIAPRQTELPGM